MQVRARVVRAGEAAAAEAHPRHVEVAAMFLHHDVGGQLAGAKEAVLGLIDGEAPAPVEVPHGLGTSQARAAGDKDGSHACPAVEPRPLAEAEEPFQGAPLHPGRLLPLGQTRRVEVVERDADGLPIRRDEVQGSDGLRHPRAARGLHDPVRRQRGQEVGPAVRGGLQDRLGCPVIIDHRHRDAADQPAGRARHARGPSQPLIDGPAAH